MEVFYNESPIPHITIQNYYSDDELKLVWLELEFLTNSYSLNPPEDTGSATDLAGKTKKKNHGIFLDNLYTKRNVSNILRISRKHFDPNLMSLLAQHHFVFKYLEKSRRDTTLLSYYEDSDQYLPHEDDCVMTAITWLFKEPRQFQGGNLFFSDYNYEIPIQNNFMVIFPSTITHSVEPIRMESNFEPFSGYGRYALTNFIDTK